MHDGKQGEELVGVVGSLHPIFVRGVGKGYEKGMAFPIP